MREFYQIYMSLLLLLHLVYIILNSLLTMQCIDLDGDGDDVSVTSDEERNIIASIREEMKKDVVQEMQHELDLYKYVLK